MNYMKLNYFFGKFRACPCVHTFCKYFKGYKKEKKHEIERQLLVQMSEQSNNDIHGVDFFSKLVHLSTLFAKEIKCTRMKENIK